MVQKSEAVRQHSLSEVQEFMASAIMRPLTSDGGMKRRWTDGSSMKKRAQEFVKPNDRLNSFERLEIYNQQYWYRVLDCFRDDFPGLAAILGEKKFEKLAEAYLTENPSRSFTLRNLGAGLEEFLLAHPEFIASKDQICMEMVRFEWAQVLAFDGPSRDPVEDDCLKSSDPDRLYFELQPYITLLELSYPLDEFSIALKKEESKRGEAGTVSCGRHESLKRVKLPGRERVHLAVHRFNNVLYYKRMDAAAFMLLHRLRKGDTLGKACETAIASADVDEGHERNWAVDIQNWFATWRRLGWLCKR